MRQNLDAFSHGAGVIFLLVQQFLMGPDSPEALCVEQGRTIAQFEKKKGGGKC